MNDEQIRTLLREVRSIAVVGCSGDPEKPSHYVADYLQAQGYRIVPVNPKGGVILGETVYEDLASIPFPIDLVNVFRPAPICPRVTRQALEIRAKAVWLQLGIMSDESATMATGAGIPFVMDRCLMVEHRRLVGRGN